MKYVQCRVKKGDAKQTAWIPQRDAKRGKIVQLQQESGEWNDGWEILAVGFKTKSSEELLSDRKGIFSRIKNLFK